MLVICVGVLMGVVVAVVVGVVVVVVAVAPVVAAVVVKRVGLMLTFLRKSFSLNVFFFKNKKH